MKILPVFLVAISLIWKAQALNCYSCVGTNVGDCFNVTLYPDSIPKCSSQTTPLQSKFQQALQDRYEDERERASNTKCVMYERYYYTTNQTEIYRGCLSSEQADMMCETLVTNANMFYYNLTKCRVCTQDLCNHAYRSNVGIISVISLLLAFSANFV